MIMCDASEDAPNKLIFHDFVSFNILKVSSIFLKLEILKKKKEDTAPTQNKKK